jgi:hypothetical protein
MCLGLALVSGSKHWLETAWNAKGNTAFSSLKSILTLNKWLTSRGKL